MRTFCIHCATIAVLVGCVPNIVWAGATGRRNTAIAATAVAAGAWSNGTGRTGRRNTAILATAGAAYAWSRYADKKKEERRHTRRPVIIQSRPARRQVVYVPARPEREVVVVPAKPAREVVYVHCKGKKHGHCIGKGHHKHHCNHDDDD